MLELDLLDKLAEDVIKIVPDNVLIDIDSEFNKSKNKNLYTIYLSDLNFYLKDERFKKFSKILKKKYKQIYFIFAYKGNQFNNNN